MAGLTAISGIALYFCFFALYYYPTAVRGCSCIPILFTLTDLQSACRDYRFARNVFTARVRVRESQCHSADCSFKLYNYTFQVVNVFKGYRQVGDVFTDRGPDTLSSCGDPSNILKVGITYLVGIGGPCSKIREYSPYNSVSAEVIIAIADGCSSCPYVTVRFNKATYSADESSGVVSPELILSHPLLTDITVQVRSKDISATGRVDYISGPYHVIFPARSTKASFDIVLLDDNKHEDNETFMLTISEDSLPTCAFISEYFGHVESTITIVDDDDDLAIISFSFPKYIVQENAGKVQLVLVLSRPVSTTIRVRVNTYDGTATGNGVDYISGPYWVVFSPGVTRVPFVVMISDDYVPERKEYFRLYIKKYSLPSGVTLGRRSRAIVIIVN